MPRAVVPSARSSQLPVLLGDLDDDLDGLGGGTDGGLDLDGVLLAGLQALLDDDLAALVDLDLGVAGGLLEGGLGAGLGGHDLEGGLGGLLGLGLDGLALDGCDGSLVLCLCQLSLGDDVLNSGDVCSGDELLGLVGQLAVSLDCGLGLVTGLGGLQLLGDSLGSSDVLCLEDSAFLTPAFRSASTAST